MAQMEKVKFLSPIEAPDIDVTGDLRIQGNKVLTDADSITEAGKLSFVESPSNEGETNLIWKVYSWEVPSAYRGVSGTYSIVDKESNFNGILSMKFRTSNLATNVNNQHTLKWLSATKKPPTATVTYTINDASTTFYLYIAYPHTYCTLTLAKIHEHKQENVQETFINERVTEVTETVLDTASAVNFTNSIKLQDGAIGTSSVDANGTINIPVTSVKEAYLGWGGKDLSGNVSPLDAALMDSMRANRLAFLPAECIEIEYSRDGGATWLDYEASDAWKTALVTTGQGFYIGNRPLDNGTVTTDWKLRVTIKPLGKIYFVLNKIAMLISTEGSTPDVTVESLNVTEGSEWTTVKSNIPLKGWSGWNIIQMSHTFGGNHSWCLAGLRFTFNVSALSSSSSNCFYVEKLYMYGATSWNSSISNMATDGHLYSYDVNQNATFPAEITATSFNGIATKAVQDGDGNNIVNTYVTKNELAEAITSTLNTSV